MKLTLQPRLQEERWSLYWREPTLTTTRCLAPVALDGLPADATTVAGLMDRLAERVGWPPEAQLVRLDGFDGPWQRALCRARELPPGATLAEAGLRDGDVVTVVRVETLAEGWQLEDAHALSDSDDDGDDGSDDEGGAEGAALRAAVARAPAAAGQRQQQQ